MDFATNYQNSFLQFYRIPQANCFWSTKTASALKSCNLDCHKSFSRKVIFNGKTYKYLIKKNYDVNKLSTIIN